MTPCIICGTDLDAPDHYDVCRRFALAQLADNQPVSVEEEIPRHRETSAVSFYNAVNTGLVKTLQQKIWAALRVLGPSTISEIHRYLHNEGSLADSRSVSPRLAELRYLGVVRELGERVCRITGQTCLIWEAIPLDEYQPVEVVRYRCESCGQVVSSGLKKTL